MKTGAAKKRYDIIVMDDYNENMPKIYTESRVVKYICTTFNLTKYHTNAYLFSKKILNL